LRDERGLLVSVPLVLGVLQARGSVKPEGQRKEKHAVRYLAADPGRRMQWLDASIGELGEVEGSIGRLGWWIRLEISSPPNQRGH
jgi:hypothetical protein